MAGWKDNRYTVRISRPIKGIACPLGKKPFRVTVPIGEYLYHEMWFSSPKMGAQGAQRHVAPDACELVFPGIGNVQFDKSILDYKCVKRVYENFTGDCRFVEKRGTGQRKYRDVR